MVRVFAVLCCLSSELDPMQIILCLFPCYAITHSGSKQLTECPNNDDAMPTGMKERSLKDLLSLYVISFNNDFSMKNKLISSLFVSGEL